MAAIYLAGFLTALRQGKALLGSKGLLPVPAFLAERKFRQCPTLFLWRYSDRLMTAVSATGVALSVLGLLGLLDRGPIWLSMGLWLTMWFLYLSIVNVGQRFYGFGWESMVLEAGFFTAFLGPSQVAVSPIPILALRWMLFRVEFGAGMIKVRHDKCWRDLTCLYYHYETQPMPNPLSWYFHHLPRWVHRGGVLGSHFVQLVVPFGLFAPQPVAALAGLLIIGHQLWLIVSGNYSWLNWITVVLGFSAFGLCGPGEPRPLVFELVLVALAIATAYLSIKPTKNLLSKNQAMNRCYNVWHLVNTYGAFGSVTRNRHEVVIQGTPDLFVTPASEWREYQCWGKPGELGRRPAQLAPYHLRLDWLLWFLPLSLGRNLSERTAGQRLLTRYESWFKSLIEKMLAGDAALLKLFRINPFPDKPPGCIRVLVFAYQYTTPEERRQTGNWWKRQQVGVYLPPWGG